MSTPGNRPPSAPPRKAPRIAELGRPETPDETAARKAENSRRHRTNQTTRNLVLALLASLGIVLFLVLAVVRPNTAPAPHVDWASAAKQAQSGLATTLASPDLPKSWTANDAELKNLSGTKSFNWYIGFITPKQQFIAVEEGIDTTDAFYGQLLGTARSTGHVSIGGVRWTVYNQRDTAVSNNFEYSLTATIDSARVVLHGTAAKSEFTTLATAVADSLQK